MIGCVNYKINYIGALTAFDKPHGTGGYYHHYHDKKHTIHVWFGNPV